MPFVPPELQAFANGFPVALLHVLISLALFAAGLALHASLSPSKPIDQVRHGNGAAAVALGGAMLALALPLGVSMVVSGSLIELAVWGVAVTLVELLLLRLVDMILRGLPERIRDGDVSAAVLLLCARLATAILLACAVAG
jgi:putative membrane protein